MLKTVLGVDLSDDKCLPPATLQTFLGLELDTIEMCLRVPPDKLGKAAALVAVWLTRVSATKRQLQSLLGRLIHIATAVLPGRRFVARVIELTKLDKSSISLDYGFRLDLQCGISSWSGITG